MAEIIPAFARCLWKEWVDPLSYDKSSILETIKANYGKQRQRNIWGNESSLHHQYNDEDNPDFLKVDYSTLIPVYEKILDRFFEDIGITCKYKFMIDNYTVTNQDQNMQRHTHIGFGNNYIDFTGVHYIECDSEKHAPISFYNDDPQQKFLNYTTALKKIDRQTLYNSYFNHIIDYKISEDYLLITPSDLTHEVKKVADQPSTDKDRICIVTNIQVLED